MSFSAPHSSQASRTSGGRGVLTETSSGTPAAMSGAGAGSLHAAKPCSSAAAPGLERCQGTMPTAEYPRVRAAAAPGPGNPSCSKTPQPALAPLPCPLLQAFVASCSALGKRISQEVRLGASFNVGSTLSSLASVNPPSRRCRLCRTAVSSTRACATMSCCSLFLTAPSVVRSAGAPLVHDRERREPAPLPPSADHAADFAHHTLGNLICNNIVSGLLRDFGQVGAAPHLRPSPCGAAALQKRPQPHCSPERLRQHGQLRAQQLCRRAR